jgi:hypothetical protein
MCGVGMELTDNRFIILHLVHSKFIGLVNRYMLRVKNDILKRTFPLTICIFISKSNLLLLYYIIILKVYLFFIFQYLIFFSIYTKMKGFSFDYCSSFSGGGPHGWSIFYKVILYMSKLILYTNSIFFTSSKLSLTRALHSFSATDM